MKDEKRTAWCMDFFALKFTLKMVEKRHIERTEWIIEHNEAKKKYVLFEKKNKRSKRRFIHQKSCFEFHIM